MPHPTVPVISEAVLTANHSTDNSEQRRKIHNSVQLCKPKRNR